MNNYYLKMQELSELRQALRVQRVNEELLEHLESTIVWLLDYCERNNIELPNLNTVKNSIERARYLLNQIYAPPKFQHPFKTPKDSTEPPKGSHLTEEHIENNRKAHLGLPSGFKGKKHTPEANQKNRDKHVGKTSPRKGAILSEYTKRLVRKARSKQIFPLRDSKPERIMQIALALNGINFKKHKSISDGNGFYHQVDIFIKPNICLEVDGEYWHTLPKVIERDNEVNNKLKKLGYNVIRVKENIVTNGIQAWIESVLPVLNP